jgi:hypothetical protein
VLSLLDNNRAEDASARWIAVLDRKNAVVLADCGSMMGFAEVEECVDLDADGKVEAVIVADDGGAHGDATYYVCEFYPKFSLLAGIQAGRGSST